MTKLESNKLLRKKRLEEKSSFQFLFDLNPVSIYDYYIKF
jgi:hypothetical protein